MKRRILLIIVLFSVAFHSYGQLYGQYFFSDSLHIYPVSVDYSVCLGFGNSYGLILTCGNGELFSQMVLSRGHFDLCWDTLILQDNDNGNWMLFGIEETGLVPIKTVSGLMGKSLRPFMSEFFDEWGPEYVFGGRRLFLMELANSYHSSAHEHLYLFYDHTYMLECYGKMVTNGTWERHWNRLLLKDDNLDKPFVGKIKKNRLEIFGTEMGACY